MPRQLDVSALSARTRVVLVQPERYGMELDPLGPLAAARLVELVDTVSMLSGVIMVHDVTDQTVVSAFRNACSRADLVAPLQLWQTTDLPGWFQSAVRG